MLKTKVKPCSRCGKDKVIFANKTIDGERKQFCQTCAGIVKKELDKKKRKVKREKKKTIVTDKQLHTAFAKLIKQIYPLVCHACGTTLILGDKNTHACHFCQRGRKIVTWDIRNVYPGCATCNGFVLSHVYELGKKANMYWGEGTAEMLRTLERQDYNWSQGQKRELYELFTNPPQADTLEQTRQLILEQYLKIKG